MCTPGVLTDRTAASILASSMKAINASLDHGSGASPPTDAWLFSVSRQKKSGSMCWWVSMINGVPSASSDGRPVTGRWNCRPARIWQPFVAMGTF